MAKTPRAQDLNLKCPQVPCFAYYLTENYTCFVRLVLTSCFTSDAQLLSY